MAFNTGDKLNKHKAQIQGHARNAEDAVTERALLSHVKHDQMQRLHLQAVADLRWAIAHPQIQEGPKVMLEGLLAWMEEHPTSLLPRGREGTVGRILQALRMIDKGMTPKPPEPGTIPKRPRKFRPRFYAAPVAPFLTDPSLLPKKPPTRTP